MKSSHSERGLLIGPVEAAVRQEAVLGARRTSFLKGWCLPKQVLGWFLLLSSGSPRTCVTGVGTLSRFPNLPFLGVPATAQGTPPKL